MENLYTFIMHYCGGKYITQVLGTDEVQAMHRWVNQLAHEKIEKGGPDFIASMKTIIINEIPTKIDNTENVWGIFVLPCRIFHRLSGETVS